MNEQQIQMLRDQGKSDEEIAIILGQGQQEQQQAMSYADPNSPQVAQQSQAPVKNDQQQMTMAPQAGVEMPVQQPQTEGFTPDPRVQQMETQMRQQSGKRSRNDFNWAVSPATDSEAFGEGLFTFGLKLLASSSRPGATFGEGLAEGLAAGTERFMGALNRNKRYENIEKLQEKGFNDVSIDEYLKSGDNKVLSKDPVVDDKIFNVNNVAYRYDPVTKKAVPLTEAPSEADKHIANAKVVNGVLVAYNPATRRWEPVYGTPNQGKGAGTGSGSGSRSGKAPKAAEFDQVYIDPKTDEPVYYRYEVNGDGETIRVAADPNIQIPNTGVHLPYDKYASVYSEKSKGRTELIDKATTTYSQASRSQYLANNILNNPNIGKVTGQIDTRTFTIFDDASQAEIALEQLGGDTFLAAFERLKGGGQITEIEGKKASNSLLAVFNEDGTLKPKVTATALKEALKEYTKLMEYDKAISRIEENGKKATIDQREKAFKDIFVKPNEVAVNEQNNRLSEWNKQVEIDKAEKAYKGPPAGQVGFVPPAFRGEWEYMEARPNGEIWGRKHGSSKLVVVNRK
ncbi:MAG: hypothetical protein ACRDCE_22785 [Cetobacterium sp.]|uniref:hypothetical protein n=1 Tax=Cetobacterium sp. TaxID=2071632 RepID=UPI003EE5DDD9